MPEPLPLSVAAAALGISVPRLRRLIAAGAPVARRGRRGRGGAFLVDAEAVRRWQAAGGRDARLHAFAADVPRVVAEACAESFAQVTGPHKRATAGVLAGAWYVVTIAILGRLRAELPELTDPTVVPESVERLREIGSRP
jgi:hypothetical protein